MTAGPHSRSALPAWRKSLAEAVRDPAELLRLLALDPALLPAARRAAERFPLRVPRGFVARMRPGDPDDPLLRQILPLAEELEPRPGFGADPVGDLAALAPGGLVRKYHGRSLLVTTGACAVHCRYCFRRDFPYAQAAAPGAGWSTALEALEADPSVQELILSGGDPLTLPDRRLAALARAAGRVAHLRRLRVHSRTPVVLPERVDDSLLYWLAASPLPVVMVIHANHAQELDAAVASAMGRLAGTGVTLLNQAVLLRGVNDTWQAQVELSERLFELGVLPYYLHLLDPVAGAGHFDVPEAEARRLLAEAGARLPGYLLPRLAREVPGETQKRTLAPWAGAQHIQSTSTVGARGSGLAYGDE